MVNMFEFILKSIVIFQIALCNLNKYSTKGIDILLV